MAEATLDTLFLATLRDVYYAERRALAALKKQARAASHPDLRAALEQHQGETEGQIDRLRQIFDLLGKRAQGKTCHAMDGLVEEAEEILEEYAGSPALDAALVGAAQAVEHYEITRYGTLAAWARQIGNIEAEGLLNETLREEKRADALLTKLAEMVLNPTAEASAA